MNEDETVSEKLSDDAVIDTIHRHVAAIGWV